MAYQTIENNATINLVDLMNIPNLDFSMFYPIFLFVVFLTIASLLMFRESDREGRGNFLSSLAVASFVTQGIAIALRLLTVISRETLVITMVIGIAIEVIYLLTFKN